VNPCWGVLISEADWAQAIGCMRVDLPGCRGKLTETRRKFEIKQRDWDEEVAGLDRRLRQCEQTARRAAGITRPWHSHPWVLLTAGFVAGTVTAYAVTRIVDSR
jgi:hypothetical protein